MRREIIAPSGDRLTVNVGFGVDFFRPFFWLSKRTTWWVLLFEHFNENYLSRFFTNAFVCKEVFVR
jgi:hypothetical protein